MITAACDTDSDSINRPVGIEHTASHCGSSAARESTSG
jgi:hypothetical protein